MSTVTTPSWSPRSSAWRGNVAIHLIQTDLLSPSSIVIHLLTKLNKETVYFKKNVSSQEKSKAKKVKTVKSFIRKKEKEISKLRKKTDNVNTEKKLDLSTRELYSSYQELEDLEEKYRQDLKETEQQFLTLTLTSLQSVFKEEVKLYKNHESLNSLFSSIKHFILGNNHENEDVKEEIQEVEAEVEGEEDIDIEDVKPPDVAEKSPIFEDTITSLGSRTGSFISLSSLASFSCKEETASQSQVFSTVKRCHSPFTRSVSISEQTRRRETRRRLEVTRPPLPPLPPRYQRHRLEEISGAGQESVSRPLMVPRSPYMEENSWRELSQKLKYLSSSPSETHYQTEGGSEVCTQIFSYFKVWPDNKNLVLEDGEVSEVKIANLGEVNGREDIVEAADTDTEDCTPTDWRALQPPLSRLAMPDVFEGA